MRIHHLGGRARLALAMGLALVVGLVGTVGTASAAPRDNFANSLKCLRGGWQGLTTSGGRPFPGTLACMFYALRGNPFGTAAPSAPPAPPAPPEQPPPGDPGE